MELKNRYSFWRFRWGGYRSKAMRRLGKTPDEGKLQLGDIVICIERADEQARELGNSFVREVAFLTIHSTLHLLGYDHEKSEEDDRDMRARQRVIMDIMGLTVESAE